MKIMYIAPRFHTNQAAVVKGWLARGDEVVFISYYMATIEDYSELKPVVLGFSFWYKIFDKIYVDIIHKNEVYANGFKINYGFPPLLKLWKVIHQWKPDIVIVRDRTLYSIAGYLLSRKKSKCILYNQSPMWDDPPKKDLAHKLVYKLTPKYRITPVMGKKCAGKIVNEKTYFLPFVVEPKIEPRYKMYFENNIINILCIGVFEPRKHHIMLLDAVGKVSNQISEKLHITVIGVASETHQKDFLKKVRKHIEERHYENMVTILTNIPKKQMDKHFAVADIFVIPSTKEMASISQLEAMSYSIPVICSDSNGSACYVIDGENGYQFEDCNQEDLERKLLMLLGNRDKIVKMGEKAYQSILKNNSFLNYYEGICEIVKDYHE